jgi:hypothetical protein
MLHTPIKPTFSVTYRAALAAALAVGNDVSGRHARRRGLRAGEKPGPAGARDQRRGTYCLLYAMVYICINHPPSIYTTHPIKPPLSIGGGERDPAHDLPGPGRGGRHHVHRYTPIIHTHTHINLHNYTHILI